MKNPFVQAEIIYISLKFGEILPVKESLLPAM
jgi:hypothetical protein